MRKRIGVETPPDVELGAWVLVHARIIALPRIDAEAAAASLDLLAAATSRVRGAARKRVDEFRDPDLIRAHRPAPRSRMRQREEIGAVVLTGGCLQNRLLSESLTRQIAAAGLEPR